MWGKNSEVKYLYFKKYGHYCNKARQMNVIPVDFRVFKEIFSTNIQATMRSIVEIQNNKEVLS